MEILYLLVPVSVALAFLVGAVFWFALKSGQFDDMVGPGLRVIADDDRPRGPEAPVDLDQMQSPAGRYADTLTVQGSAETQGAKHAGTRDV